MYVTIFDKIHDIGLIPVLRIYNPSQAVPLAGSLINGGIPCAAVTYCLKTGKSSIRQIREAYPNMIVGSSTILTPTIAKEAVEAGAQFILTQGFNAEVIDWCREHNVPVIPGVNNEETLQRGLEKGLTTFNFFPCELAGGAHFLRRLHAQYPQARFITSGGVTKGNLATYAKLSNVLAVICPWVAQDEMAEEEQWEQIVEEGKAARLAIQGLEISHIGINNKTRKEADKTVKGLETFGMLAYPGKTSTFMEADLEILDENTDDNLGHITYKCNDVERTLAYLLTKGFTADTTSATIDMNGTIKTIILNETIGGFCIHLARN